MLSLGQYVRNVLTKRLFFKAGSLKDLQETGKFRHCNSIYTR